MYLLSNIVFDRLGICVVLGVASVFGACCKTELHLFDREEAKLAISLSPAAHLDSVWTVNDSIVVVYRGERWRSGGCGILGVPHTSVEVEYEVRGCDISLLNIAFEKTTDGAESSLTFSWGTEAWIGGEYGGGSEVGPDFVSELLNGPGVLLRVLNRNGEWCYVLFCPNVGVCGVYCDAESLKREKEEWGPFLQLP